MESPVFWDITVCSLEKRQHERPRRCVDRDVGCENGRVDESGPGYCPVALLLVILNREFCYCSVTLLSDWKHFSKFHVKQSKLGERLINFFLGPWFFEINHFRLTFGYFLGYIAGGLGQA
jgi:hypothetical protein